LLRIQKRINCNNKSNRSERDPQQRPRDTSTNNRPGKAQVMLQPDGADATNLKQAGGEQMRRKEVESVEAGNVGKQRTNEPPGPRVMLHSRSAPMGLHLCIIRHKPHRIFEDAVDAPYGVQEGFVNGTYPLAILQ
jgi:hypothetical protein